MDMHRTIFSSLPEGNEGNYHIILTGHRMDEKSVKNRIDSLEVGSEDEARHSFFLEMIEIAEGHPSLLTSSTCPPAAQFWH